MMSRTVGFAIVAMTLLFARSALADPTSCGEAPYPPALPSLGDIARLPPADAGTAKHQAFEDVVSWQKSLKAYRACLNVLTANDDRKITGDQNSNNKDDKDEITGLRTDEANINTVFNKTVDTEKSIVSSYDSLSKQYCSRKDVDLSSCQGR
jgi:hypothetical protein